MLIPSLSNKDKVALIWVIIIAALLFVVGERIPSRGEPLNSSYHVSAWNEFAPEVDRAIAMKTNIGPVALTHVYGGLVPHHIPTTIPDLVKFYLNLKATQPVKKIIVIGPDHNDAGVSPVTVSAESFYTAFSELKPIKGLAEKLQQQGLANIEERPFDPEHSVGSQILVISKIFPDVQVTPIIFRSNTSRTQSIELGKSLAASLDSETVLIASVDFSHYLPTELALPIDQVSSEAVRNLDRNALKLIEADSDESLLVFMTAMRQKNATKTAGFKVLNTNDFMQNSDFTTGYVFGFWGVDL